MSMQGKSGKGGSLASRSSSKASLFAIVVHHGYSISNGHYVCYINTFNGWFKMDDATVKTCTEEEAMKQNAYLLFYQKNDKNNKFYRGDTITEIAAHIARAASPVGSSPVEVATGVSPSSSTMKMKVNPSLSRRNRSGSDLFARSLITATENNANLVNKGASKADTNDKESDHVSHNSSVKKVTVVKKRKLPSEVTKNVKVTKTTNDDNIKNRGSKSIIGKVLGRDSSKLTKTNKAKESVKRVTIRAKRYDNEQSEMDTDDDPSNSSVLDWNDHSNENNNKKERIEWIPWMSMGGSRDNKSNNQCSSTENTTTPPKPKRGVLGWVNHWLGGKSSNSFSV